MVDAECRRPASPNRSTSRPETSDATLPSNAVKAFERRAARTSRWRRSGRSSRAARPEFASLALWLRAIRTRHSATLSGELAFARPPSGEAIAVRLFAPVPARTAPALAARPAWGCANLRIQGEG